MSNASLRAIVIIVGLFVTFFSTSHLYAKKMNETKKLTIYIDPGHGGKDYGALSEGYGYEEKQLTLTTSLMLKNYLQKLGYRVLLTRTQDVFIPLQTRAMMANDGQAELFVSVHFNFSPNDSAHGIEVYYCKNDGMPKEKIHNSKKLAEEILSRVVKHTGAVSRGVKTANFAVIRHTEMPAVLIEGGFLSNGEERQKLKDPRYLGFIAWGIARGVDQYVNSAF